MQAVERRLRRGQRRETGRVDVVAARPRGACSFSPQPASDRRADGGGERRRRAAGAASGQHRVRLARVVRRPSVASFRQWRRGRRRCLGPRRRATPRSGMTFPGRSPAGCAIHGRGSAGVFGRRPAMSARSARSRGPGRCRRRRRDRRGSCGRPRSRTRSITPAARAACPAGDAPSCPPRRSRRRARSAASRSGGAACSSCVAGVEEGRGDAAEHDREQEDAGSRARPRAAEKRDGARRRPSPRRRGAPTRERGQHRRRRRRAAHDADGDDARVSPVARATLPAAGRAARLLERRSRRRAGPPRRAARPRTPNQSDRAVYAIVTGAARGRGQTNTTSHTTLTKCQ